MFDMLADVRVYRRKTFSVLAAYMIKNRTFLEDLYNLGLITLIEMRNASSAERHCSRIYGLAKDHKDGCPLRPVVNTINTPGYTLAKKLADLLGHIRDKTKHNVTSSRVFADLVRAAPFDDAHRMVTADIKSMFTNVTKEMVIKAIEKRYERIKEVIEKLKCSCLSIHLKNK